MDATVQQEMPLWRRARELRESGRYSESLQQLDLLLTQELNNLERAWVLCAREQCLVALDRIAEAKSCLEQACALADDYLRFLLEFDGAFIAFAEKQYTATVEMIQKLLERYPSDELQQNPDYSDVYLAAMSTLGQALFRLGQYSDAIKPLETALSAKESLPAARYEILPALGGSYYHLGDYRRARLYFEAALDEERLVPEPLLSPDITATLRYWLAFIAHAQNDFDRARRELDAAAKVAQDEQLRKNIENRRRSLGN